MSDPLELFRRSALSCGSVGAHYAIGISFAALLLAPWLVLQPAFGAGIASSKTAAPVRNAFKSLVTHTVFGFGLFLAAHATAFVVRSSQ